MSETDHNSQGCKLGTSRLAILALAAVILMLGCFLLLKGIMRIRETTPGPFCATNMSILGKAMAVYADNNHGKYPTADKWCDLLIQGNYMTDKAFICPASRTTIGRSSYALNKNIVGMKRFDIPADTVLLFESNEGWNQVGGPEILTTKNHKGNRCYICFNDGSVRSLKKEQLGELKWKVEDSDSVGEGFSE